MENKKSNNTLQFFIIGFIFIFIIKNFISIANGSYGGDPIYIISNPSIDEELWYLLGITYLLSVKVFYKEHYALVILKLNKFKILNQVFNVYYHFSKTKLFKILIITVLLLIVIITILLSVNLLNNDSLISKINWILFVYITYVFNKNFKVINF